MTELSPLPGPLDSALMQPHPIPVGDMLDQLTRPSQDPWVNATISGCGAQWHALACSVGLLPVFMCCSRRSSLSATKRIYKTLNCRGRQCIGHLGVTRHVTYEQVVGMCGDEIWMVGHGGRLSVAPTKGSDMRRPVFVRSKRLA